MSEQPQDLPCRDIVELVTAYLDGDLDDRLRDDFDAHLTICEDCVVYVDQMRRTIGALGQSAAPEQLPADLREGLRQAFRDWPQAG